MDRPEDKWWLTQMFFFLFGFSSPVLSMLWIKGLEIVCVFYYSCISKQYAQLWPYIHYTSNPILCLKVVFERTILPSKIHQKYISLNKIFFLIFFFFMVNTCNILGDTSQSLLIIILLALVWVKFHDLLNTPEFIHKTFIPNYKMTYLFSHT